MPTCKIAFVSPAVMANLVKDQTSVTSFHRVQFGENSPDLYKDLSDYIFKLYVNEFEKYVNGEFILRYIDEAEDVCAIATEAEILEAVHQALPKIVKIYVTTGPSSLAASYNSTKVADPDDNNHAQVRANANMITPISPDPASDFEMETFGSFDRLDDDNDYVELDKDDYLRTPPPISPSTQLVDLPVQTEIIPTLNDSAEDISLYTEMQDLRLESHTPHAFPTTNSANEESKIVSNVENVTRPSPNPYPSSSHDSTLDYLDFDVTSDPFDANKEGIKADKIENDMHRTPSPGTNEVQHASDLEISTNSQPLTHVKTEPDVFPSHVHHSFHLPEKNQAPSPRGTRTEEKSEFPTFQLPSFQFRTTRDSRFHCKICGSKIEGTFYRCLHCYKFNLCEPCAARSNHPVLHPLIKVRNASITRPELRHAKCAARSHLRAYHPEYLSSFPQVFDSSINDLDATFIHPDHDKSMVVKPGESVTKSCTLVNSGRAPYPNGTRLRFTGGTIALACDAGNEKSAIAVPSLLPRDKVNLSILIIAPNEPGQFNGMFTLCTPDGKSFGSTCEVAVTVQDSASTLSPSPSSNTTIPFSADNSLQQQSANSTSSPPSVRPHNLFQTSSLNQNQNGNPVNVPVESVKPASAVANRESSSSAIRCDRVYPVINPLSANAGVPHESASIRPSNYVSAAESNIYQPQVRQLVGMGFDAEIARYMIILRKGNIGLAINDILGM